MCGRLQIYVQKFVHVCVDVYVHLHVLTAGSVHAKQVCMYFCMACVDTCAHMEHTHKLAMDGYSIKSFVSGLCRGGAGCTVQ